MQDRDLVAAIVAGDPGGLAAAYDRYASALYAYCRTMLRDPEDAADALQDTFVVAAQKLDGLRDRDRFRPWLYAVARNECLRRVRSRQSTVELDQAGEVSDDGVDVDASLRDADIRGLIWSAIQGLNEGEREVFELSVRHELEGADLAAALGVSQNHAHALLSRARGTLEKSLGALLVARTGKEDCPELAEILEGWDGELTPLLRKRVNRHVEQCDICGERKKRELRPEALLGALPILLLPAGLRAKVMHLVGYSTPTPPGAGSGGGPQSGNAQSGNSQSGNSQSGGSQSGQSGNTQAGNTQAGNAQSELSGSSGTGGLGGIAGAGIGSAEQYCKDVAKRAEPFDHAGFPVPLGRRRRPLAARHKSLVAAVIALLLLLGLGGYTALHLLSPTTTADVATPSQSPTLVITLDSSSPVQVVISSPPSPSASASPSPSPSPSLSTTRVVVVRTSSTPSRSPSRSPSPSPSPPPPPGTLVVAPFRVIATPLNQGWAGTVTLSATNGPIPKWSVVLPTPAASWGTPYAQAPSGSLKDGGSTPVVIGEVENSGQFISIFVIQPGDIEVELVIESNG